MKQQVKNIGTEVKEAKLISVYSNLSVVSRFLPKHIVAQLPYVFTFFAKQIFIESSATK